MGDDMTKALDEFQTGLYESTEAAEDLAAQLKSAGMEYRDLNGAVNKDGKDTGGTFHIEVGTRVRPDEFTMTPQAKDGVLRFFQGMLDQGNYSELNALMRQKHLNPQTRKRLGLPDVAPKELAVSAATEAGEYQAILKRLAKAKAEASGAALAELTMLEKVWVSAKAELSKPIQLPSTPKTKAKPTPTAVNTTVANLAQLRGTTQETMTVSTAGGSKEVPVVRPKADSRFTDVRKIFKPMANMDPKLAKATTNMLKYTVGGAEQEGSDYYHQPEVRTKGGLVKHEALGMTRFDHIISGKRKPSGVIEPEIAKDFSAIIKETGLPKRVVADMVKSAFSIHDIAKYPGGKYDPLHGAKMFNVVSAEAAKNYVSTLEGMGGEDPAMRAKSKQLAQELILGNLMHHYSENPEKGLGLYDDAGHLNTMGKIAQEYGSKLGFKSPEETVAYLKSRPGARITQNIDHLAASTKPDEYDSYMGGKGGVSETAEKALDIDSKGYLKRVDDSYAKLVRGERLSRDELDLVRAEGMKSITRAIAYHSDADPKARESELALANALGLGRINEASVSQEIALVRNAGKLGAAKYMDANGEQRLSLPKDQIDWLRSLGGEDLSKLKESDWSDPKVLTSLFSPEVLKGAYITGFHTDSSGKQSSTFFSNMAESLERFRGDGSFAKGELDQIEENIKNVNRGFTKMVQSVEGTAADTVEVGKMFETINESAKATAQARMDRAAAIDSAERVAANQEVSRKAATSTGVVGVGPKVPTQSEATRDYALRLATIGSANNNATKVAEAKELLQIQKLSLDNTAQELQLETKQNMAMEDRIALEKVAIQQGKKAEATARAIQIKNEEKELLMQGSPWLHRQSVMAQAQQKVTSARTAALALAERERLAEMAPKLYDRTLKAEAKQTIESTEHSRLQNKLLKERINLINFLKTAEINDETRERYQMINNLLDTGNSKLRERNSLLTSGRDYMGTIGAKDLNYGVLGLGTPKDKGGGLWGKAANFLGTNPFQLKQNAFLVGSVFGVGATSAWAMLRQATDQLKQAELASINLGRVFNGTTADLQALQKEALSMSVQYGQSIQDIGQMQEEWAKTGKESYSEISKLTEATVLALNTSNFESAEKATKSLNSAITQMGIGADKVIDLLDSWNAVADAFPADTQDLAEAYERSGSYAKSVGMDTDELNALAITIMERTGRSGAEAGTAMRAIFSNVFKDKSVKTMEGMGIQVYQRDAEGKIDNTRYRDFVDILKDAGAKYTELSAAGRTVEMVELANALGQARQRNFAIAAMEGMSTFEEKVETSRDSSGYSQAKMDKTMESWDKKAAQLGAAFQSATVALADTGLLSAIKGLTEGLTSLLKVVSSNEGVMEEHGHQLRTVTADIIGMSVVLTLVNKSVKARTTMTAPQWVADKVMRRSEGKWTASMASRAWAGAQGVDIGLGVKKAFGRELKGGVTDPQGMMLNLQRYKSQENFFRTIGANAPEVKNGTKTIDDYVESMIRMQTVETANIAIMDASIAKTLSKGLAVEATTALDQIYSLTKEEQIALSMALAQAEGTEAIATIENALATDASINADKVKVALDAVKKLSTEEQAAVMAILNAVLANNKMLTEEDTKAIIANTLATKAASKAATAWTMGITLGITALVGLVSWLRSAKKQADELANTRIKVYVERIEETKQAQASALTYNQAKNKRDAIQARIEAQNKQDGLKEGDAGYVNYRTDEEWKDYNRQTQDAAVKLYGYIPNAATGGTYVDGEYVPEFEDAGAVDAEIVKKLEQEKETANHMKRYWGERLALNDQDLSGTSDGLVRFSPAGVQALIDSGNTTDAIEILKNTYSHVQGAHSNPLTKFYYRDWILNKYGDVEPTEEMWLEALHDPTLLKQIRSEQVASNILVPGTMTLPREGWLNYQRAADAEEASGGLADYISELSFWRRPLGGLDHFDIEKAEAGYNTMLQTQQAAAIAPKELLSYYARNYGTSTMNRIFNTYSPSDIQTRLEATTDLGNMTLPITLDKGDLANLKDTAATGFNVDIASTEGKELLNVLREGGQLEVEPTEGTTELFLTLDQLKYAAEQGYTIPIIFEMSKEFLGMYASGEVDPASVLAAGALARVNALDTSAPPALFDKYGDKAPKGLSMIETATSIAENMTAVEDYEGKASEALDKLDTMSDRLTKGTATSADLEKFFTKKVIGDEGFMSTDALISVFKERGYLSTDSLTDTNWVKLANDAKGHNDQGERLFTSIFEDADRANRKTLSEANAQLQDQLQFFIDAITEEKTTVKDRLTDVNTELGSDQLTEERRRLLEGERDALEADLAAIEDKYGGYTGALQALQSGETALTTVADFDFKDPVDEFSEYMEKVNKGLSRFDNAVDKAMHALEKFDALNQFSSLDPAVVEARRAYVEKANTESQNRMSEREAMIEKVKNWKPGETITISSPYTTASSHIDKQSFLDTDLYKIPHLSLTQVEAVLKNSSFGQSGSALAGASAQDLYKVQSSTGLSLLVPLSIAALETGWTKKVSAENNYWNFGHNSSGMNYHYFDDDDTPAEAFEHYAKLLHKQYYVNRGLTTLNEIGPTYDNASWAGKIGATYASIMKHVPDSGTLTPSTTASTAKTKGQALAALALKEVGYETGGGQLNEFSKYTKALGINVAQAWCADFVSALAQQAGIELKSSSVEGLKSQVNYHAKGTYTPKPGDISFHDYEGDSDLDHVEIVVAVDSDGNVTTVGGNTTGGKVKKSVNKSSIVGYGSYTNSTDDAPLTVQLLGDEFDEYERAQALWDMEAANRQDELDIINRQMEQRQLEYRSRMEVIERALYATDRIKSEYAAMYGDITDSLSYVTKMNTAIDDSIATRHEQIENLYNELAVNGDNYDWLPEIQQQIDDLNNSIYELQWEKLNNDLALFDRRLQDIDESVVRLNNKLQIDTSLMGRNVTKDYKISGGLTREQYGDYYKNKEDWNWASQQRLNYVEASEKYAWFTSLMTRANQANIALRNLASETLGFDVGDNWEAEIPGVLTEEQYAEYYKNKEDWNWANQQRLNYAEDSEKYTWLTNIMTTANQANTALRNLASVNLGFDVGEDWETEILGVAQATKVENLLVDNTLAKAQVMMKGYNDILWQTRQAQVELTSEIADLEERMAYAIANGNTEAKVESLARNIQAKRDLLQKALLDEAQSHDDILGYLTDLTKYGYQEALEEETKLIEANLEAERKRHEEWLDNRKKEQDLLKERWEDEDQAKKIAEIDEDIAELEEKKANLDGDTSQYAAKLRKDYQDQIDNLKKQKAEAQLQYERTLQQRQYDDEVEAENEAYDDYVEAANDKKEALTDYYNDLIDRAAAYVNGLYEAFGRSPQLTLGKLTELIPEIAEAGLEAAEAYMTAFQQGLNLDTLTMRLKSSDFGIDQSMLGTIPEEAQRKLIENSVDWLNLYMAGYAEDNPVLQALSQDSMNIRTQYGLDEDWLPEDLLSYRKTLFKGGTVADMQDRAHLSNVGDYITTDGITKKQANKLVSNSEEWWRLQDEANELTQNGTLAIEDLDSATQSRLKEIKTDQSHLHSSSEQIRLQAKAFYESTGRILENWETWMPVNSAPYAEYAKGENSSVVENDTGITTGSRSHGLTSDQVAKYKQNKADWQAWESEKESLSYDDNMYRWLQSVIDSPTSTEEDRSWATAEQAKYEAGWKRVNELIELQKKANEENQSLRDIAAVNLGKTLHEDWVPTFGDGGIVEEDGLAFVHKREMILPEVYANAIDFIAETLKTPRMSSVQNPNHGSETKVEVKEAIHIENAQFNDEIDLDLIEKRAGAKLKADLRAKGIR